MNISDLFTRRTLLQKEIQKRLDAIEEIEHEIRRIADAMNSAKIGRECSPALP